MSSEALYERYKDALRRGHVASLRGRLQEALTAYAEAATIAPERATPHTSAGTALMRRKRPADALRHYEVALTLAPRDEAALLGRAQALAALDRRPEAADAYDALAEVRESVGQARRCRRRRPAGHGARRGPGAAADAGATHRAAAGQRAGRAWAGGAGAGAARARGRRDEPEPAAARRPGDGAPARGRRIRRRRRTEPADEAAADDAPGRGGAARGARPRPAGGPRPRHARRPGRRRARRRVDGLARARARPRRGVPSVRPAGGGARRLLPGAVHRPGCRRPPPGDRGALRRAGLDHARRPRSSTSWTGLPASTRTCPPPGSWLPHGLAGADPVEPVPVAIGDGAADRREPGATLGRGCSRSSTRSSGRSR